jgi:hypothetical protein
MAELPKDVEALVVEVVAHAGLRRDQFAVWLCPPPPAVPGGRAAWFRPDYTIPAEPNELLQGRQRDEANAVQGPELHRVAVLDDFDRSREIEVAILAGLLRHEVEHARQWIVAGEALYYLDENETQQLVEWKAGPYPANRPLYRCKPREQDANAAASMFLRSRFPEALIAEIGADPSYEVLVLALEGPEDPRSLLVRTVCFQFLFHDLAESADVSPAANWADHLEDVAPGAGAIWRSLYAPIQT